MKDTRRYSNGFKTAAILLQMVFLVVVIVLFSLLSNLFGRSMLSFTDLGSSSFFDSFYYRDILAEETRGLSMYLQMQKEPVQDAENELYKEYKLRFDGGDSNLYYWFCDGEKTYTNMAKDLDQENALHFAKKLGSYLWYDDSTVTFGGNITGNRGNFNRDILRLFESGNRSGALILAVDMQLLEEDTIAEAKEIYTTYFPLMKVGLLIMTMAMMGFVLVIIYITLATGRNTQNDEIRLYRIDYLPTEALFIIFVGYMSLLIAFCARLSTQSWNLSSSLILVGSLVFISDNLMLALYLSFVRRIKTDTFFKNSITALVVRTIREGMRRQRLTRRAMIIYSFCSVLEIFFIWELYSNQSFWAVIGLVVLFMTLGIRFWFQAVQRKQILEGILEISSGKLEYKLQEEEFTGDYRELAIKINSIGEGLSHAVEENVKSERLKTELITNVSHDIKTPLTSIINYINLIKMEKIQNERIENYVNILEMKSLRLKQLTEDLVEISKITSGTIQLEMHPINMVELIYQTGGEFNEIFEDLGLTIITRLPKEPVMIMADGSRIWRVIQNLYNNVAKYALKDTRVYVELKENAGMAEFSIKDISAQELHKSPQDLSERFVRGDESRGTEGSGLGLSIARNLTMLMGGTFEIAVDDDLFTVKIGFPIIKK
ncbi:MAG: HAMP domain-containing histidine kinase [Lachnospiraceae bacterium]|nr:HAMP domain-containing histidine kinase [Lachnospiraceae bacterium]